MAAPKFSPVGPIDTARSYSPPDHVPDQWNPERPGEIEGFQPDGPRLGDQGPDQGYALRIAHQLEPKLRLGVGEHVADIVEGCLGVALRRASMFSRAPVVHDLNIAFTIWGAFDDAAPAELVELRRRMFEGVRHTGHHYTEARAIVDMVPDATLKMTTDQVAADYPANWRTLLGV